ncbi:hypothetical protein O0I10_005411 [Lichtheimia ornata]|uniref:F-box domain-containing protein n=1 Tax=Lichtheimia ornata TaxID=688661 RepID=A0AAD7XVY6_9FUNG|nr:uncharacterized protein O0I10_005411 [Lichtheimia ornata]KAJ8659029.1 hypothetical protein O0I10_005411 [Lichtheimia ornata]
MMLKKTLTASRHRSVCDLPLELHLRVASYLNFSDLWYFGICSRSCQKIAEQLIYHKYHIDLARQRTNSFNHLIHAAVAFVCRHGYDDDNDINNTVIQWVANRLAVEIYDRTPQYDWAPCFDYFIDRMLGIMLEHVLCDPSLDPVPSLKDLPVVIKSKNYKPTRMGYLMTNLLVTLYPTLTALFDAEPASAIHHRLLLAHICKHIDTLTRRYHQQQRRRLVLGNSNASLSSTVRHGFRVLIQFVGTLAQTELLTAADLHTLTQQRIIYFFLSNNPTTPPPEPISSTSTSSSSSSSSSTTSLSSPSPLPSPSISSNSNTTPSSAVDVKEYFDQHWLTEETEFQTVVLFDLLRAVMCRQYAHWDSDKELHTLKSLLNETVNALGSCRSNNNNPSEKVTPTSSSSSSSSPPPSSSPASAIVPPPSPISPSR